MKAWLAAHKKAIAGAIATGIGAGVTALISGADWKTVLLATLAGALGGGGVVGVSPANKPAKT